MNIYDKKSIPQHLQKYFEPVELGLELTFQEYIAKLIAIFNECYRVLRDDGTCYVNLGDTYGGTGDKKDYTDPKYPNGRNGQSTAVNRTAKSLCQIPSRFAIAMTDNGWILRNEIIWHKPNAMPSSAKDRFTVDFEKVFFFTKKQNYYFEQQLEQYCEPINRWGGENVKRLNGSDEYGMAQRIRNYRPVEQGKNMRTVWSINTSPFPDAHFATFPEKLAETCIKSGCPKDGIVLDPFSGAATTGVVCKKLVRQYIGVELNPEYVELSENRIKNTAVNNSIMEFI
jgi:DNA modification methylase